MSVHPKTAPIILRMRHCREKRDCGFAKFPVDSFGLQKTVIFKIYQSGASEIYYLDGNCCIALSVVSRGSAAFGA
jgi:hypothetical protein